MLLLDTGRRGLGCRTDYAHVVSHPTSGVAQDDRQYGSQAVGHSGRKAGNHAEGDLKKQTTKSQQ